MSDPHTYRRIIVIGCPGSGKTTFSRRLGEITGIPVVHLDTLYWRENWQHIEKAEFDRLLAAELEKDTWIVDGNFTRTLGMRLEKCDCVIWLDYPRLWCMWGMFRRVVRWHGKSRPDMGGGCPERFDLSFIKFIWNFRKENQARIESKLAAGSTFRVFRMRRRRQTSEWLAAPQDRRA